MSEIDSIFEQARERGRRQGYDDQCWGGRNPSPLSGEWAGESITELLGDLVARAYSIQWVDGMEDDICQAFLSGYDSVFDVEM